MAFTNEQVIVEIRYFLGDVDQTTISDETLNTIITRVMLRYNLTYEDGDFCKTVYYSLIETLRYLIRQDAVSDAQSGGDLKSFTEKVGGVTITEQYSEGTSTLSGWDSLLQQYLSDPSIICEELADLAVSTYAPVLFGGVSKKERDRVNSNPDSFNGWDVQSPYREHLRSNIKKDI